MRPDIPVSYLECFHSFNINVSTEEPKLFLGVGSGSASKQFLLLSRCTLCHLPHGLICMWFRTEINDIYCHSNVFATRHPCTTLTYLVGMFMRVAVQFRLKLVVSAVSHNCWDNCQLIVCRGGEVRDAARITYSLVATLSGFIMVGV
jgi:hypothetical protein